MAVSAVGPLLAGQLPLGLPATTLVTSTQPQPTQFFSKSAGSPWTSNSGTSPSLTEAIDSLLSTPAIPDGVDDFVKNAIHQGSLAGTTPESERCSKGVSSNLRHYFSWIERLLCRWDGYCNIYANKKETLACRQSRELSIQEAIEHRKDSSSASTYWTSGTEKPETWSREKNRTREIPQYVLDYAPYVHLFSGEEFWPCDLAEHLIHTSPHVNYTAIERMSNDRTLDNLDELNEFGWFTYLQSDDNVEERPRWLGGSKNIPELARSDTPGGHSSAPAILVVVPKENGIVDAFWFYFYSYNLGNKVFNVRFGNHVGDWEHSLVRFKDGKPDTVFLSEHNFGEAYGYDALEKIGKRPVIYSATGTHAMYAQPGLHPYVLPWGILHDQTDRGPLWDPRMNVHAYTFNLSTGDLLASTQTPKAPTNWFHYRGKWGDKAYPMTDKRQYKFAGQYHYVSGPLGARFKNLGRKKVCQGRGECRIKHWLGGDRAKELLPGGDMDEEIDWEAPEGRVGPE